MRTVAVIYAGDGGPPGSGLLAPLGGRPMVEHSVAAFAAVPQVDSVLLIAAPALTGQDYGPGLRILEACGTRARSIARALGTLGGTGGELEDRAEDGAGGEGGDGAGSEAGCNVLIHDADRPLVGPRVIADCLAALAGSEAVCAAVPASDTMVAVQDDLITGRPPRDRLRFRQYPQGFRLPVIRRGYKLALADPAFREADDCAVMLRYLPGVPVRLVPGSEQGLRVTSQADLGIAETLIQAGSP